MGQAIEVRPDGSGLVAVEAMLDNSSGHLKPGMTGWAEVDGKRVSLWTLAFRRFVRWVRVRFVI